MDVLGRSLVGWDLILNGREPAVGRLGVGQDPGRASHRAAQLLALARKDDEGFDRRGHAAIYSTE